MTQTIQQDLKRLRLNYLAENLSSFSKGCDKEKSTTINVIEKLTNLELVDRDRRGTERRLREARLGRFKKIHEFDWAWPKNVDRNLVERLLTTDFIDSRRNILLAGAQGLGKTMLAKNIAHQAILKGKNVFFTTASDLVMTLQARDNQVDLNRTLKKYAKPDLLVIDELGYLSYDCKAADMLFEVINRRYENGSIVFTTNLAFKDWNNIFPGAACLTAMIDRITHYLDIVKLDGDSYRLMESKRK